MPPTRGDDDNAARAAMAGSPRLPQAQRIPGWAEPVGMSGGGTETPVGCEGAAAVGSKKRDSLGTAGSAHLIIKGTQAQRSPSARGWLPRAGRRSLGVPGVPGCCSPVPGTTGFPGTTS